MKVANNKRIKFETMNVYNEMKLSKADSMMKMMMAMKMYSRRVHGIISTSYQLPVCQHSLNLNEFHR